MPTVYVLRQFPVVSETFVLQEMRELIRQGETIVICSLAPPDPAEPTHHDARQLAGDVVYLPAPAARGPLLAGAGLALARHPWRAARAAAEVLVLSLRHRSTRHGWCLLRAAWLYRRLGPFDHVHAHFAHDPATVALLLARLAGTAFSFTAHARDIFQLTPARALSHKVARARFVVTVCEYTRSYVRLQARAPDRAKVLRIPNGIDHRRFTARTGQPTGVPLLLCVARLVAKKGVATLIRACAVLAERGVAYRCQVVGDGPLRAPLAGLIADLGLTTRVRLLGALDQRAVLRSYGEAAVFVLPCRIADDGDRDALPVAILEAMSVGVPVIATPVAGIREVVRDGDTGLLVPPASPVALADAIERLLADRPLRTRLATAARPVADGFDLRASAGRLRRLFAGAEPGPVGPANR